MLYICFLHLHTPPQNAYKLSVQKIVVIIMVYVYVVVRASLGYIYSYAIRVS
jgi:hypothetical protein